MRTLAPPIPFADSQLGQIRHVCAFFNSADEEYRVLLPFIEAGFACGDANGAPHPDASAYAGKFVGKHEHQVVNGGVGHNLPQEAPAAFAQAVMDVDRYSQTSHNPGGSHEHHRNP